MKVLQVFRFVWELIFRCKNLYLWKVEQGSDYKQLIFYYSHSFVHFIRFLQHSTWPVWIALHQIFLDYLFFLWLLSELFGSLVFIRSLLLANVLYPYFCAVICYRFGNFKNHSMLCSQRYFIYTLLPPPPAISGQSFNKSR